VANVSPAPGARNAAPARGPARWGGLVLGAVALAAAPSVRAADGEGFLTWAPTPPMGWNSWDCFATTVDDAHTRLEADYMADHLARHGWSYIVVDIQWYEPAATGYDYHAGAPLTLDGYGRLVPAANKFPSAAGGAGFGPLAAYVHGKGLKFGLHLMRGIPRQAVDRNLPILGTSLHAADIADRVHVCPWNSDMYGVAMAKPGAQAYYDSVFALIASWGVDFVKVDDIARPYLQNEPEIEAVRRAIDRTGRAMVLSLSPGETDIRAAEHVVTQANMWRISDDFWDHWSLLYAQFARLDRWSRWRRPGAWPDADMIPIGTIEMGRKTWFTHDEEVTLMTLWCIARSPLILGADLTRLDEDTLSLLTNDEVLAVNQSSAGNRPLFRDSQGGLGWVAEAKEGDRYLALFNTRDPWVLADGKRLWRSDPVSLQTPGQEVAFDVPVQGQRTVVLAADPGRSTRFWWPSLFRELRWVDAEGKETRADRDYGSHGEKISGIAVPGGAVRLRGMGRLDDAAREEAGGGSLAFAIYGYSNEDLRPSGMAIPLEVGSLGLGPRVSLRDLWTHRDLGSVSGTFAPEIEWHGARLYRVSAAGPEKG
jgi:alpha-galactosidase